MTGLHLATGNEATVKFSALLVTIIFSSLSGDQIFGQDRPRYWVPSGPLTVKSLAEVACHCNLSATDNARFLSYLGIDIGHPMRGAVQDINGKRFLLGIGAEYCHEDGTLSEDKNISFLIGNIPSLEKGKAEGYYFMTSPDNGNIFSKGVHNCSYCEIHRAVVMPIDARAVKYYREALDEWLNYLAHER